MTVLLTDNLPLLAGAPNGIKKLRELILELAVRGKLVEQDASDEPADELLRRIAEEKARLVAEGKIKKQKPLPVIGEEEKPFELPAGWEWARLGDFSKQVTDGEHLTPPRTPDKSKIPLVTAKNVRDGYMDYAATDFVERSVAEKCWERCCPELGDIMMVSVGATLGRLTVIPTNQEMVIVRSVTLIKPLVADAHYLALALKSPGVQRSIWMGVKQSAQPCLYLSQSTQLILSIPPLAEQHRIVAKVDELMALCDRLEAQQVDAESAHAQLVQALLNSLTQASDATDFAANWQRLTEHFHTLFTTEPSIDALKQALLLLAVMGKLVTQDPNDEPASELLKRIQAEKQRLVVEGKLKQQKPLDEIIEERPFALPPAWAWVKPEEFSIKITDGEHFKPDTEKSGVYFLSAKDIRDDGVSLENPLFISEETAKKALQRCDPEYGDLLIVSRGATVGRMCKVNVRERFCLLGSVILIKPSEHVLSEFLSIALKSPDSFQQLINASGSTAQPAIYLRDLKKIALPLPPLTEQHRIVAKLDQLMALCDQLKTRLTQARQLNEQLASTLVEQAVA